MSIIEDHLSPDGLLRLIVTRADDGDFSIGFDRFAWHTHGDILSSESGLLVHEAIRAFIDDVMNDRQLIVISTVNGIIQDIWPTDDPKMELTNKPAEESLQFRLWSGRSHQVP